MRSARSDGTRIGLIRSDSTPERKHRPRGDDSRGTETIEPSIITAAVICEQAGANGITVISAAIGGIFKIATSNFCVMS